MIHIRMSDLDNSARPCLSGASERDERALYSHAGSTCELDLEITVFIQDAHPVSDETLPGFLFAGKGKMHDAADGTAVHL
jgi:hypothetical protein